jgi:L-alanine-DL-glutamate epimerase-like enolase superfamily enzyme
MKIWPFDPIAKQHGGERIEQSHLQESLAPFHAIRGAIGDQLQIMVEGHGFWSVSAAQSIAASLEQFEICWLEDLTLADDLDAMATLRASTSIPIAASEYFMTVWDYQNALRRDAMDIVMIDPTWVGGITESLRIARLARDHGLPVTTHDATGPFNLLAGLHLGVSVPGFLYQETVRAYLRVVYPQLIDNPVDLVDGAMKPPSEPGIGARLLPDVRRLPGVHVVSSDKDGRRTR